MNKEEWKGCGGLAFFMLALITLTGFGLAKSVLATHILNAGLLIGAAFFFFGILLMGTAKIGK